MGTSHRRLARRPPLNNDQSTTGIERVNYDTSSRESSCTDAATQATGRQDVRRDQAACTDPVSRDQTAAQPSLGLPAKWCTMHRRPTDRTTDRRSCCDLTNFSSQSTCTRPRLRGPRCTAISGLRQVIRPYRSLGGERLTPLAQPERSVPHSTRLGIFWKIKSCLVCSQTGSSVRYSSLQ